MLNDFFFEPFPLLAVNSELILREQILTDAPAFLRYYSHQAVGQHILAEKPSTLAEAQREIHHCRSLFYTQRGIYWTLAIKPTDHMIGAIGVYLNPQHSRAEICYDLDHRYWNQGIMTAALRVVIDFCFNKIGLVRLEANLLQQNSASIALLSKLGFTHEGTLHQYRYYQNQFHDIELYALLAPPFVQTRRDKQTVQTTPYSFVA